MNISFRHETPADYYAVEEMTREAFWYYWEDDRRICDEHMLVNRLRSIAAFVPELDYVAELDGRIIGHIIFTKSRIKADDGRSYETLTFGPLTVMPEFQNRGVGKALMLHSFDKARQLGYRAVIIFGHPDYYPRVGFKRAVEFGLTTVTGITFDAFMALPLYDGALNGIHGTVHLNFVYEQLTQKDALEFDKRFPPKAPHIPVPISALLERLEPDAAKAVQRLGFKNALMLRSRSEREMLLQPGMDVKAVETIRATLREQGFRWGT